MDPNQVISIVCILCILGITITLILRDTYVQNECDKRFEEVSSKINKINTSRHEIDQRQTERLAKLEDTAYYIQSQYVPKAEMRTQIKTDNVVTDRLRVKNETANDFEVTDSIRLNYAKKQPKTKTQKCMLIEPYATNFSIQDGVSTYNSLAVNRLKTNTLNIRNAAVDKADFNALYATDATLDSLKAPKRSTLNNADITNSIFDHSTIAYSTLPTSTLDTPTLKNTPVTTATVDTLKTQSIKATSVKSDKITTENASFDTLKPTTASINDIYASKVNLYELRGGNASHKGSAFYDTVTASNLLVNATSFSKLNADLAAANRVIANETANFDTTTAKNVVTKKVAGNKNVCIKNACLETNDLKTLSQGKRGNILGGKSTYNPDNINTQFPGPDLQNYVAGDSAFTKPVDIKGNLYNQNAILFRQLDPTVVYKTQSYKVTPKNETQINSGKFNINDQVSLDATGMTVKNPLHVNNAIQFGTASLDNEGLKHQSEFVFETKNAPSLKISPEGHMQLKGDLTFSSAQTNQNWRLTAPSTTLEFVPTVDGLPQTKAAMTMSADTTKTNALNARHLRGQVDTGVLYIENSNAPVIYGKNQLQLTKPTFQFNAPTIDMGPMTMTSNIVYTNRLCFDKNTCITESDIKRYMTQGPQGIPGDQGITGKVGIQGLQGDTGDTGEKGIRGVKGRTGNNILNVDFSLYAPKGIDSGGPVTFSDNTNPLLYQPDGFSFGQFGTDLKVQVNPKNHLAFSVHKNGTFEDQMVIKPSKNVVTFNTNIESKQGIKQVKPNKIWIDHNRTAGIQQADDTFTMYAPNLSLSTATNTTFKDIVNITDSKVTLAEGDLYVDNTKLTYDDIKNYKARGNYTKDPSFEGLFANKICVKDECVNAADWDTLVRNFGTAFNYTRKGTVAPVRAQAQTLRPVDCVAEYGPWSSCDANCTQTQTLQIKQQPLNNGAPCPTTIQNTRACTGGECISR